MAPKKTCHGKHRELGNFVKTQGKSRISFVQVVNFQILKIQDIAILAAKLSNCSAINMNLSKNSEIDTGKNFRWDGKVQGKHREFENRI